MFSVIPANRACIIDFTTVSPTQFAFSFSSTPHFSHLVVFILPGNVLPIDTAAGVYLQLPGSTEVKFLGAIGNEKPSAIFRVNLPAIKSVDNELDVDVMSDAAPADNAANNEPFAVPGALSSSSPSTSTESQPGLASGEVKIGISVEPLASIQAQLAGLQSQSQSQVGSSSSEAASSQGVNIAQRRPVETKALAQRIIKDAFNFLAGFAGSAPGGQEVVPIKSFQEWWTKFERRVENDPHFLERVAD